MREMRDSGVGYLGEIPAEWGVEAFSQLFGQRNEKVADTDYAPLSVTMKGVVPQLETVAKSDDHSNRKLVRKGDFAINSRSDRRNSCGFAMQDGSVSLINTICVPRAPMESRYFGYLFATSQWADEFYSYGHGIVADLWTTSWSDMKRIPLSLPPLSEQRRIAEWLDERCADIDAAVEAARASIDEYEAYKKSVISHAVTRGLDPDAPLKDTGIPWLGQIPVGWEVIKQKYLMTFTNGRAYAQNEFQSEGKYRVLRVGNCNTNSTWYYSDMELAEDKYCDNGDLLYLWSTTFGPYIWIGEKVIYHYHIWKVEPREEILDKRYAYYMLEAESDWQRSQTHGFTMVHITKAGIEGTYAPLPPLPEQRRIAAYLDARTAAIDAVVAQKRAIVEDLLAYKKSLIYEAVTGKREV